VNETSIALLLTTPALIVSKMKGLVHGAVLTLVVVCFLLSPCNGTEISKVTLPSARNLRVSTKPRELQEVEEKPSARVADDDTGQVFVAVVGTMGVAIGAGAGYLLYLTRKQKRNMDDQFAKVEKFHQNRSIDSGSLPVAFAVPHSPSPSIGSAPPVRSPPSPLSSYAPSSPGPNVLSGPTEANFPISPPLKKRDTSMIVPPPSWSAKGRASVRSAGSGASSSASATNPLFDGPSAAHSVDPLANRPKEFFQPEATLPNFQSVDISHVI